MAAPVIEVARCAGVCYGVERALRLAYAAAEGAEGPVHTLGALIHNPIVVADLSSRGIQAVETPAEAGAGTLVMRAHGVPPEVEDDARARGLEVVDATCPFVKKAHRAAAQLAAEGYQVVVLGEAGHPEVLGILGHAGADALVVAGPDDLAGARLFKRVGLVVQTTQTAGALAAVVGALAPQVDELRVMNTICTATQERQEAAAGLAARADVMVVIGGRNSGNTRRLAQICAERCANTHHVEDAAELERGWFAGARLIGVTAGASTPASHIDRARERIERLTLSMGAEA